MSSGPDGMPSPDANGGAPQETVQLVEIELRHIPQVCQVINEGFRTKRCCFVFPVPESESEMRRRYSGYPASKLALGAVAVQENTNKIIGYVQMAVKGHPVFPLNIHTCRAGEMYIEQIAVSADARGMGVGTKLLDWCEAKARSTEGITGLTLEVLRGNRTIRTLRVPHAAQIESL